MKERSDESNQKSTIRRNNTPERVMCLQKQSSREIATRTRGQSQASMTYLEYLSKTRISLTPLARPLQCGLPEIIKPNIPIANFPKVMEYNCAEIRDLINRCTLRAVLRQSLQIIHTW